MNDISECWHSILLPNGEVTPGKKSLELLQAEEEAVFSFIDVQGCSVLDIGAWDGYFSFAAERRQAKRVTACDHFCWIGDGWGTKNVFDYCRDALSSRVEEWIIPVEELPPGPDEWDFALLLGVTYHLKSPIAVLERIRHLVRKTVVVETAYFRDRSNVPLLRLIPDSSFGGDPTNWNLPNLAGAVAMMEIAGYRNVRWMRHPVSPKGRVILAADA